MKARRLFSKVFHLFKAFPQTIEAVSLLSFCCSIEGHSFFSRIDNFI